MGHKNFSYGVEIKNMVKIDLLTQHRLECSNDFAPTNSIHMNFVVNVESTICTIECTEKHIDNGKQYDCGYYIVLGVQYYYML